MARSGNRREFLRSVAAETVSIVAAGSYISPQTGERVDISKQVAEAQAGTQLFPPHELPKKQPKPQDDKSSSKAKQTEIEVVCCTSLVAAAKYSLAGKDVAVLNFASAKNPGGGFLKGSSAQEESLARSSALYSCLTLPKAKAYYNENSREKTCLYTDNIIYSPKVPVIRNDEGNLLPAFYQVAFISSPAVNTKHASRRIRESPTETIQQTLTERAERVLSIASAYNHPVLILGAWGCGVFGNETKNIAELWRKFLIGENAKFANSFERVVFAITEEKKALLFGKCFGITVEGIVLKNKNTSNNPDNNSDNTSDNTSNNSNSSKNPDNDKDKYDNDDEIDEEYYNSRGGRGKARRRAGKKERRRNKRKNNNNTTTTTTNTNNITTTTTNNSDNNTTSDNAFSIWNDNDSTTTTNNNITTTNNTTTTTTTTTSDNIITTTTNNTTTTATTSDNNVNITVNTAEHTTGENKSN